MEALKMGGHVNTSLQPSDSRAFVLAGNAIFTIVSRKTGTRFTYRVRASATTGAATHFIDVLTGSDNNQDYEHLGWIARDGRYVHGRRSRISPTAPSSIAFAWAYERLGLESSRFQFDLLHAGRCGKCGRLLTDPESIRRGLGAKCAAVGGV